MRYEILLAPEAIEDLDTFTAGDRAAIRDAIEAHLWHQPAMVSKARIKRLRGLTHPQYRLPVGDDVRVFNDVTENAVHVLAIVPRARANQWLAQQGRQQ
jgi:mRNA interferase RelE/StbE